MCMYFTATIIRLMCVVLLQVFKKKKKLLPHWMLNLNSIEICTHKSSQQCEMNGVRNENRWNPYMSHNHIYNIHKHIYTWMWHCYEINCALRLPFNFMLALSQQAIHRVEHMSIYEYTHICIYSKCDSYHHLQV